MRPGGGPNPATRGRIRLSPPPNNAGGDLKGFILVRGSQEQMATLRADDEFQRLNTRAALIVERLGVVDAALGDGLGEQIAVYQEAVIELT